ncbi:MAG: ABC transporter ATP-binding protein [Desulfobacteraceae bacterium]|jgi:ABC-type branched-subunit amino acid transport system ATPase component
MSFEFRELLKDFGGIRALDGVSFETPHGAITGLIGPNGSGKTTLFNVLTGFLPLDRGQIFYKGRRIDGLKPHQVVELGIIRTFQITRVFPRLTLLENLLVPTRTNIMGHLLKTPKTAQRSDKAKRLLGTIGLESYMHEPAASLSYGQSKLLELILSFMIEADIVLLDEPSAGINPTLQARINDWIRRENEAGKEFLIIEHNMEVVMNLCHHIVVLHNGCKLAQGEPAAIQRNQEVLDAYLGD